MSVWMCDVSIEDACYSTEIDAILRGACDNTECMCQMPNKLNRSRTIGKSRKEKIMTLSVQRR